MASGPDDAMAGRDGADGCYHRDMGLDARRQPVRGSPVITPPRAIFLDRDGTLIENRHYLRSPEGVALLPGVRDALVQARGAGASLFLFTNQSGVGRGYFTMADVKRVNDRMIALLDMGGDPFTDVCIAPERPDEPPRYRKPSPRFIEETLARRAIPPDAAWMVGDSPSDWEAGLAAGIRSAAIVPDPESDPHADRRRALGVEAHASLLQWVSTVLR